MPFQNPADEVIERTLRTAHTIAVVGLSTDPERPSHRVAAHMQRLGYRIVPVRPGGGDALGERAYASLRDIPFPVDIVDVFRAPEHVAGVVDEALAIGATRLWLQQGVINEAEAVRAQAAGMLVVMDRCIWQEAQRLLGGAR